MIWELMTQHGIMSLAGMKLNGDNILHAAAESVNLGHSCIPDLPDLVAQVAEASPALVTQASQASRPTGSQPLHMVAGGGAGSQGTKITFMQSLVIAGAHLDAQDGTGATPMMLAAQTGNRDIVQWLHEASNSHPARTMQRKETKS